VEVSVSALREGAIQIEVLDRGTGMDEETQRRAFEWFTRRGDRGGRGLTLCCLLVRQREGGVQIGESRPANGTTMRIVLPWMPS
jgi:signal transduction histidine kinase